MELRHLRYFVAVAETLSFSRAAQRLHLTQPALSRQVRDVEDELGCELFLRTRGKIALTAAGQTLLDMLALLYVMLRVFYILMYVSDLPTVRSAVWAGAFLANIAILFVGYR